jgi:hypothetical protein
MSANSLSLDELYTQALHLEPLDKVRLVERLMATLERELTVVSSPAPQSRSWRGVCAHLGRAPSTEEIDAARREEWANFPREDIA